MVDKNSRAVDVGAAGPAPVAVTGPHAAPGPVPVTEQPVVLFERLPHGHDLDLPRYETPGAAGMDVRAAEDATLEPGETVLVVTGFKMAVSPGWEIQLRPRSGLALKHGLTLLNSPATIDADYRGEVKVILTNLGKATFQVARGDRIAQMVIAYAPQARLQVVEELDDTVRGAGGFGSTGV